MLSFPDSLGVITRTWYYFEKRIVLPADEHRAGTAMSDEAEARGS
jgi:hypothetical protein